MQNRLQWVQDPRTCRGPCRADRKRMDSPFQLDRQSLSPPFLTGGAFVDLRVRSPSEELHSDSSELGHHCNGSQQAVSAGLSPGLSPPQAPRTPSPALSTCGRKARCSLCSSDKSSSILAGLLTPPRSAGPALATSCRCAFKKKLRRHCTARALGSGLWRSDEPSIPRLTR